MNERKLYRDYMDSKKGEDVEVNILGKGTWGGESKSQRDTIEYARGKGIAVYLSYQEEYLPYFPQVK